VAIIWGDQVRAHALGVSVEEAAAERDSTVRHYVHLADEWRARYFAAERVIRTMSERSVEERAQVSRLGAALAGEREAGVAAAPPLDRVWWFAAGAFCAGLLALVLRYGQYPQC
jgi:hypothetical protein